MRSIDCSRRRPIAWRTGGPRRTKSTTAGSSISTRSPGCASRTRKCSRRRTSCSATLIRDGKVQAVRIDHPDGLFDPRRYFCLLQQLAAKAWSGSDGSGGERPTDPKRPMYVVAEKILSAGEQLPVDWAVHGTTGYNYLNDLNGLFVDAAAGASYPSGIRQVDRRDRTVRGRALRGEAADRVHRDGERAQCARAYARSHRREQPQVTRLHARQPPRRHHRSGRLLPGVSNLRRRARLAASRPRCRLARDRSCPQAQSRHGVVDLRFLPRGRPAARPERRSGAARPGAARRVPAGRRGGGA